MKVYVYGMQHRGFGPGCQPREGFLAGADCDKKIDGFWSKIVYDRKLDDEEVRNYELTFLGEDEARNYPI